MPCLQKACRYCLSCLPPIAFVLLLAAPVQAASGSASSPGLSLPVAGALVLAAALAAFFAGRQMAPGKVQPKDEDQPPPVAGEPVDLIAPVEAEIPPPVHAPAPGFEAETEDFLSEAQELARMGFFRANLENGMIEASPFLRDLFGFSRDEPLSFRDYESRVHPDDRSRVTAARDQAFAGNGELYELRYRVSPGSRVVRQVSARVHVVRSEDGRPTRLFGVIQDLTDREEM